MAEYALNVSRSIKYFVSKLPVCVLPLVLMLLQVIVSCDDTNEGTSETSELVIEGWIDAGDFPVVKVSRSIRLAGDGIHLSDLEEYVDRWARVTVSDGERECVLVGRYDKKMFPPFVYTTSEMRGKPGHKYRITVEAFGDMKAEAVTDIPMDIPSVDSFSVEPVAGNDTLCRLYAYTRYRDKCRFFVRVRGKDTDMFPSYMCLYDSVMIGADGKVPVNKGSTNVEKDRKSLFCYGDTVEIKIASLDNQSYRFWRDFEDMLSLSRNPLFPISKNLHSNVDGALGYWFGYGARYYKVVLVRGKPLCRRLATHR
ncbi:DUF4249 family protein [Xylanibacter muris]|uniref:DUF4249 family protein n=1 Tax=Xylanibacter muris TaxID=2736290 RepID=A0ABX2AN24_9BACT|nr:DUF4249 family protein [Xylanibacter muris]NPD92626.1 DUF4249 family protein [Xylanibacter muris]